jgi:hypothetical protein
VAFPGWITSIVHLSINCLLSALSYVSSTAQNTKVKLTFCPWEYHSNALWS